MKNRLVKVVIAIATLVIVPQIHAYRYSFSNHTNKKIVAAIKFQGSKWYEFCVVQPRAMCTIGHGNQANKSGEILQTDIPTSSMGLVPSQFFYYIPNPGEIMTLAKQQTVNWRAINITWVPSESYRLAIELAENVGKTTEALGKTAAKAGAAYMTGGVSTLKESGETVLADKTAGKADALKKAGKGEYGVSGLLGSIGKSAARSLIGDRHIDIIEDEDGKLYFISLL